MTCTKCNKPIERGQPYHKTRRGPHHRACTAFAAPPCSVEIVGRSVIEKKLLDCLQDTEKVAAILTKQDLEDMIAALRGYVLGDRQDDRLTWRAHIDRRNALADGMEQLLKEAFPPNIRI